SPQGPPRVRGPAAVPGVRSTAAGDPLALARPSAQNAALRSSIRTLSRRSPACARRWNSIASGALRDPGASTTSFSPHLISSSTSVAASAVDGFTARPGGSIEELRGSQHPPAPGGRITFPRGVWFSLNFGYPPRQDPAPRPPPPA